MVDEPEISDEDLDRALRVLGGCDCSWCGGEYHVVCFYDYAAEYYNVFRTPLESYSSFQERFHKHLIEFYGGKRRPKT